MTMRWSAQTALLNTKPKKALQPNSRMSREHIAVVQEVATQGLDSALRMTWLHAILRCKAAFSTNLFHQEPSSRRRLKSHGRFEPFSLFKRQYPDIIQRLHACVFAILSNFQLDALQFFCLSVMIAADSVAYSPATILSISDASASL